MSLLVIVTIVSCAVGLIFLSVVLYGAPYLPTRRTRILEAIDLLDLQPGQLLLELGSGDGRILRAAARRGIRGIGYELNPFLVIYSRVLNLRYRGLIHIKLENYWQSILPPCDGIYVFLLNPYMTRLDAKLTREIQRPVKVLSFAFPIPTRVAVTEQNGLLLYVYGNA